MNNTKTVAGENQGVVSALQTLRFGLMELKRLRTTIPRDEASERARFLSVSITNVEQAIMWTEAARDNRNFEDIDDNA